MPELVTGATGYVGGRLTERLLREGRSVRALARNPSRLEAPPEVKAVKGDLVSGRGLKRALDGCDVAYYLVHSMEPAAGAADWQPRTSLGRRRPPGWSASCT